MRAALAALAALIVAAPAAHAAGQPLDAYRVDASGKKLEQLAFMGYDILEDRHGNFLDVVATPREARALRAKGFDPTLLRDGSGRTARQRARVQGENGGYAVYRPYNRPALDENAEPTENLVQELKRLAVENPVNTKLEVIGHSLLGVPIYAMKVTKNARSVPDGQRPAVLYSSTQHAREWLSTDTNRRMMRMFIDNYGKSGTAQSIYGDDIDGVTSEELTKLVDENELWFVLVCNPDGYDYTFSDPDVRLWRKNLRDNNGDGEIDFHDGVDPNRNFATHWGYDNEGSSPDPTDQTFRGTAPQSEPETRALDGLMKRVNFEFNSNYHTAAALLLYPFGWQMDTHAADEPIFRALLGTDEQPAVEGFNPGTGSELYITNGDTNDHAYTQYGTASFTPELLPGQEDREEGAGGFVFQDIPEDAEFEFERQVQYGLDLARSAKDPANPVSHLGNEAEPFELDAFDVSYGDPQVVQIDAKRELGPVTLHYKVGENDEQTASTQEWKGGERYGDEGDVWYHRVRGTVTGAQPGDNVKVWFEAGGVKSKAFTYHLASDDAADVLILSMENYTGGSPGYADKSGPNYLSSYTSALQALGVSYDVWDVDAGGGLHAPSPLGVLSHYKAVVWYTGDDFVTREPGQGPGTGADKVAQDVQMAVRDFLNEGGKLLLTGREAGGQYFGGLEYPQFGGPTPIAGGYCSGDVTVADTCIPLSNDFFQYWLGGYIYATGSGVDADGNVFDAVGTGDPFSGAVYTFLQGDDGNQDDFNGAGSALVTSSILTPDKFPWFGGSKGVMDWDRPGAAPYDPFTGDWDLYGGMADQSYKRLNTTVDLTGKTGGALDFMSSYDTEADWDFLFVEAHHPGQDDWTTLEISDDDGNPLTATFGAEGDPGRSCADDGSHWSEELHPQLQHYMTVVDDNTCTATGTTGEWRALTGNSGGWRHFNVDLSAYDGGEVELNIVYAQDWGTSGLGVFLDDVRVTAGDETLSQTSFEDGTGAWTIPGPPEGTQVNIVDWQRAQIAFDEANGIRTDDSLWLTFGLEGLSTDAQRQDVLKRALTDLKVLNPAGNTPGGGNGNGNGNGAGGGNSGGNPIPGSKRVRVGRGKLRAKKSNKSVYLKVWCPPTVGSTCRGVVRLSSGRSLVTERSYSIAGNRWTKVRLRLTNRVYRKLVKRGRMKVAVAASSRAADGVLRRDSARITILAPRKRK
jgi:hypothetical protein